MASASAIPRDQADLGVLDVLTGEPQPTTTIAAQAGMSTAQAVGALGRLERRGLVERTTSVWQSPTCWRLTYLGLARELGRYRDVVARFGLYRSPR